jgi:putative transposase
MLVVCQIQLKPTPEVSEKLTQTTHAFRQACQFADNVAVQEKAFQPAVLQKLVYARLKSEFGLGAQAACLCVRVVCDNHKTGRKGKRTFRAGMATPYDGRTYSINLTQRTVSLWTTSGRVRTAFVCGPLQFERLQQSKWKQADLVCRNAQWFLLITADIAEAPPKPAQDFLGVDLGLTNIATTSDGEILSGKAVLEIRHRHRRLRQKLQKKGTKSAKRKLKKLSGKEKRFATWVNHTLSKRIVRTAAGTDRGISLEDLKGIRSRVPAQKANRTVLHSWAFSQFRVFVEYKAKLVGVPVVFVNPAYTSQTCSVCGHCEKRNRTQSLFACLSCGQRAHADVNAAENIRRAAVNQPESGLAGRRGQPSG